MRKKFIRCSLFHYLPTIHKNYPVSDGTCKPHLMCYTQHCHTRLRQPNHRIQHLFHHLRIERRRWLIKQHNFRLHTQRTRNGNALLLTTRKLLCVLAALCGMVFVSGVPQSGLPEAGEATGILLALLSAVLYASDVSINKLLDQVPACERTLVQLAVAALVMIPYILLTEDVAAMALTPLGAVLLLIVGVFHTGWCYSLFFGSMTYLPAQTVVLFSYIDPIVAIFLSALLLKEPLGWSGILGAVLVLGSTLISELPVRAAAETK